MEMRRYHRLSYTKFAIVPLRECEPCGQSSMDSVLFGGNTIRCDSENTACASERSKFFPSFLSGLESFKSSCHHLWLGFINDDQYDFVGKHFKTGCCGIWTLRRRSSGSGSRICTPAPGKQVAISFPIAALSLHQQRMPQLVPLPGSRS
jgi:hypothetical protein